MELFKKYHFIILMLAGLMLGTSLRLYRIGTQLFWDDE